MSDNIRETMEVLYGKISRWPQVVNNCMITIHALKDSPDDDDPLYAAVVHNPFNVRQYQVLAIFPTLDVEVAITNSVKESVDEIVKDSEEDPDLAHALQHIMMERLSVACAPS